MLPDLLRKTLRDNRSSTVAWAGVLIAMVALQLSVYPYIRSSSAEFQKLFDAYPEAFKSMFDAQAGLATATGYLKAEVFSLTAPLILIGMLIGQGAGATAAEEQHGTMDLLLANPISRAQVVATKALAMLVDLLAVAAALAVTLIVGGALTGMDVSVARLVGSAAMAAVLAAPFGAVALVTGCATGRRGLAAAAGIGTAVAAYLVSALADLADWLRPWRVASPFHLAAPGDVLDADTNLLGVLAVLVVAGLLAVGSAMSLQRRDIHT